MLLSPQSRPRWPQTAAAVLVVASSTFNSVTGDAIIAALPVMARELGRGGNAAFLTQMIAVAPAISIMIGSKNWSPFGFIDVQGLIRGATYMQYLTVNG